MGRPSIYTPELAHSICEQLVEGKSLRAICRQDGMPAIATIFKWMHDIPGFSEQYARAKEEQADTLADEIIDIADESDTVVKDMGDGMTAVVFDSTAVARNRLRVDARKWVASKLKPKKYSDKMELSGNADSPLVVKIVKLSDA